MQSFNMAMDEHATTADSAALRAAKSAEELQSIRVGSPPGTRVRSRNPTRKLRDQDKKRSRGRPRLDVDAETAAEVRLQGPFRSLGVRKEKHFHINN